MTRNASHPSEDRDQRVYTPQFIVDRLLRLWPKGIAFDPFPGVRAPVTESILGTWEGPLYWDGFTTPWLDRTYANPPFKRLKEACLKAVEERNSGVNEIVLMAPARTHRSWLWEAYDTANEVAFLKQFAFHGQKDTFPYPVSLLYWGDQEEAFRDAFDDVSVHMLRRGS